MKRGIFISIEGTDGAGKTTQIELMKEYLTARGFEVVLTREPGGTKISERIREILLDPENTEMQATAEMLLYAASRAQHVGEVIKPSLASGKVVICDRYIDSSFVYQGLGRELEMDTVKAVNMAAIDGVMPDITFFLDLSPVKALERRKAATGADRIEAEDIDFHMRVYSGYRTLAEENPERIKAINCDRSVEQISQEIRKWLDRLFE